MSQIASLSKLILSRLADLKNKPKCEPIPKTESDQQDGKKKNDDLKVVTDFFVNGDGSKLLLDLSACLTFGVNVSSASELTEVLLDIISELIQSVSDNLSQIENNESQNCEIWKKLPADFLDKLLIQFTSQYLASRKELPHEKVSKKLRVKQKPKRSKSEDEKSTSDDEKPALKKVRKRRHLKSGRKVLERTNAIKLTKSCKSGNFKVATNNVDRCSHMSYTAIEKLSIDNRTSHVLDEFAQVEVKENQEPNVSKDSSRDGVLISVENGVAAPSKVANDLMFLPAPALNLPDTERQSSSLNVDQEVQTSRPVVELKVPKRLELVLDLNQNLFCYLENLTVEDSTDVLSLLLATISRLLLCENTCPSSLTRPIWKSVLKWCSRIIRNNTSSKATSHLKCMSKFTSLYIVDLICSFMVLNLTIFTYVVLGDEKRRHSAKSDPLVGSDIDSTFADLVSAVTRVHQFSLANIDDQFVIDRVFGCSWRVLSLFGYLWDRNRDLMKHITKRSSASLITNSSSIKQMVLLRRIDLKDDEIVGKIVSVIKCLGSDHVNNDHSTSCPFKIVLDLLVSCMPLFLECETHTEVIRTTLDIKLCTCQQLESSLGFLEEFLKKLSKSLIKRNSKKNENDEIDPNVFKNDNQNMELIIAFMTRITCYPENLSDSKFKFYKRILQKTNEKVPRQCLQNFILKSISQRDFNTDNLFALCSIIHVPVLRFLKDKLSKFELMKSFAEGQNEFQLESSSGDLSKKGHALPPMMKERMGNDKKVSIWSENVERGLLPELVMRASKDLPVDLFHYLLKFTQLTVHFFKDALTRELNGIEKSIVEFLGVRKLLTLQLDSNTVQVVREKVKNSRNIDLAYLKKLKEKASRLTTMSKNVVEMIVKSLESKSMVLLLFSSHNFFKPAEFAALLIQCYLNSENLSNQKQSDFVGNILQPLVLFCEHFNVGFLCFSEDVRKLILKLKKEEKVSDQKFKDETERSSSESSENLDVMSEYELVNTPSTHFSNLNNGLKRDSTMRKRTLAGFSIESILKAADKNKIANLRFPFKQSFVIDYFKVLKNCMKLFHEYLALEKTQFDACSSVELDSSKITEMILTNLSVMLFTLPKIESSCTQPMAAAGLGLLVEGLHVLCCEKIINLRGIERTLVEQLSSSFVHSLNNCSFKLAVELVNILWSFTFYGNESEKKHAVFGEVSEKSESHDSSSEEKINSEGLADGSSDLDESCDKTSASNCVHIETCSPCRPKEPTEFCFNPQVLPMFLKVLFSLKSADVLNFYFNKLNSFFRSLKQEKLNISQKFIFETCNLSLSTMAKSLFANTDLLIKVLEPLLSMLEILSKNYVLSSDLLLIFRLFLNKTVPKLKLLDYFEKIAKASENGPQTVMKFDSNNSKMFEVVMKSKEVSVLRDLSQGFSCACWIKPSLNQTNLEEAYHKFPVKLHMNVHIFTFTTVQSKVSFFLKSADESGKKEEKGWSLVYIMSRIRRNVTSLDHVPPIAGKVGLAPEFDLKMDEWCHVFFSVDQSKTVSFVFNGMFSAKCETPSDEYSLSASRDLVISLGACTMPTDLNYDRLPKKSEPKISTSVRFSTSISIAEKPICQFEKLLKDVKYSLYIGCVTIYDSPLQKRYALCMWLSGPKAFLSNKGALKPQPARYLTRKSAQYYYQKQRQYGSAYGKDLDKLVQSLMICVDPNSGFVTSYDSCSDQKENQIPKFNCLPSSHPLPSHVQIEKILNFESAVDTIGGPNVILYFFAVIVEDLKLSEDKMVAENEQCRALAIALKYFSQIVHTDTNFRMDEDVFDAFEPILASRNVIFSEKLVNCFINAACETSSEKMETQIEAKVDFLIRNEDVLLFFFKHKSLWTIERATVLMYYVTQVQSCITESSSSVIIHNRNLMMEKGILDYCITLIWNWSLNADFEQLIDCLIMFLVQLLLTDIEQVTEKEKSLQYSIVEQVEQLICQLHPNSNAFLHHADSAFQFLDRTKKLVADIENINQIEMSGNLTRNDVIDTQIGQSTTFKSDVMSQFLDDVTKSFDPNDVTSDELSSDDAKLRGGTSGSNTIVFDSGNETGGTEATFKNGASIDESSRLNVSMSETMLKVIVKLYTPQCLTLDFSDLVNVQLKLAPKYWAVLFNNSDVRVSSALLNLVRKVYEIAGNAARDDFIRCKFFHIISCQLYISRQVSEELIHNALALFFASQEIVTYLNFPDVDPKRVKSWLSKKYQAMFHIEAFPILLTLFLNCSTSCSNSQWHCEMATSLMTLFNSIFACCEKSRGIMLKFGIIPAVLNASIEIFQRHTSPVVLHVLMKHITEFLATVAEFAILSPETKDQFVSNLLRHLIDSLCVVWNRVATMTTDEYLKDQMNILIFQMFSYVLKISFERLLCFKTVFNPQSHSKTEGSLKRMLSFSTSKAAKPKLLQTIASLDTYSDETDSLTSMSDSRTNLKFSTEDLTQSLLSLSSSNLMFRSAKNLFSVSTNDLFSDFKDEPKPDTLFMEFNNVTKLMTENKPKFVVEKFKYILTAMKHLAIFSLPSKITSEQHKADWCFKYHDFAEYFIKRLREVLSSYLTAASSTKWVRILKDLKPVMILCVEQLTHVLISPDYYGPIQTLPLLFYTDQFFEVIVKAVYGCLSSTKETEDILLNNFTKQRLDLVYNECPDISSSHKKVIRRLELSIPMNSTPSAQQKLLIFPQSSLYMNGALQRNFSTEQSANLTSSMSLDEDNNLGWCSAQFWRQKRASWMLEVSEPNQYWTWTYSELHESIIQAAIAVETPLSREWLETQARFLKRKSENPQNLKLLAYGVNSVTHPGAVWHESSKGCQFWQLDQTEGPLRAKKRLEMCMLNVNPRHLRGDSNDFIKKDDKLTKTLTKSAMSDSSIVNEKTGYLEYIFSKSSVPSTAFSFSSMSTTRRADQNPDYEHDSNLGIVATYPCNRILPYCEISGEVLISDVNLFFWPNTSTSLASSTFNSALIGSNSTEDFKWPYTSIREVHERLYSLKDCGIEIFFTSGLSCMLSFEDRKTRDLFHQQFLDQNLPNLVKGRILEESVKAWSSEYLTNFAYLTAVNKFAGRSSNDLMQYPVFPFVLCDYESDELNLQNPAVFRDLAKPVSVQKPEKEHIYETKYKEMTNNEFTGPTDFGPYHYSSLYSNSGIVLHYLVRLLPFSRMFLHYQGDSFDIPDRTFFDIDSTWKLAAHTSMTDVKELIPEFFYLPEFLLNKTNFEFGERQDKQIVHHVHLPKWCLNDPRLFVLIHRQALESAHVSKYLHKWIDLIFGYKQTGKAAVEAHNVYRPCLYYGFDLDQIGDPQSREAVERMIRTYGQTPKQIFRNQHPGRGRNSGTQILDIKLVDFVFGGALGMVTLSDENVDKLNPKKPSSPVPSVFGLKWGNYCGSPALREPTECWSSFYRPPIVNMVTIHRRTVGVPINSVFLHRHQKDLGIHEESESSEHGLPVTWYGVLRYGFPDRFLRFSFRNSSRWKVLLREPFDDPVTCVCISADSHTLFAGCESGLIWCALVKTFDIDFRSGKSDKLETETKIVPHCRMPFHTKRVNVLSSCRPYSIFVSGSEDCKAAIWDLNRNHFVRAISVSGPVKNVTISETLGDIAVVYETVECINVVAAYTINGDIIGKWTSDSGERVTAIAYSNAPEGISINLIVVGLSSGALVTLDSWLVNQCREMTIAEFHGPVVAVTYRSDAQILYVSFEDGWLCAMGSKELNGDQKKFLPMAVNVFSPAILASGSKIAPQRIPSIV